MNYSLDGVSIHPDTGILLKSLAGEEGNPSRISQGQW
jgi:hypothetical protein